MTDNHFQIFPSKIFRLFILFSICILSTDATISPSQKGKKTKAARELKVITGPVADSVLDRGLIEDEPAVTDILTQNAAYCADTSVRNFNATVLGYVTPVSNKCFIKSIYHFTICFLARRSQAVHLHSSGKLINGIIEIFTVE